MSKWIKCSDRMPKAGEVVLIVFKYEPNDVQTAKWSNRYKDWRGAYGGTFTDKRDDALYWMELPEPPEPPTVEPNCFTCRYDQCDASDRPCLNCYRQTSLMDMWEAKQDA
ncbi:hypothetical protein AGMMS49992_29890 [Clostridia bacterium]|nr:hypothetical protein AGMMS49992_29890 [Clostridia bacterium]